METNAAPKGAERRVELNTETAVYLHLSRIVYPGHAKDDLPFGSQMRSMRELQA